MTTVMHVSPAVFSEMQGKAAEYAVAEIVYPGCDLFADWARKTFACEFGESYKVVVIWEWGTDRRWSFPQPSMLEKFGLSGDSRQNGEKP